MLFVEKARCVALVSVLALVAVALMVLSGRMGVTAAAGRSVSQPSPVTTVLPTFEPERTSTPTFTPEPTYTPRPTVTTGPLILLTHPVPDPKQAGVQWFASTGHTLRGAFLDYWNKYGGLAQFGYPLTEEFVEPISVDSALTVTVQYFQRNRFEHHPENAGTPYEVLLGTLGSDFHRQDSPVAPLPAPGRYFVQTGHNLSGAFKTYWETHGGLFVHGYPITEPYQEKSGVDGKTYMVQYFERSRFELHPENKGTAYEVLLGLLGTQSAQQRAYFSGGYPRYGHAVDYSWVAGQVVFYVMPACSQEDCGCSILGIQGRDVRVQLSGGAWFRYSLSHYVVRAFLVAFGHLAAPDELYGRCAVDDAPGYLVDQVQANPVQ